jgi:hypothetical protein
MALRQAQKKTQPTIRYADYDGEVRLPDDIGLKDGDEILNPPWHPVTNQPGLLVVRNADRLVRVVFRCDPLRHFDTVQKEEDR